MSEYFIIAFYGVVIASFLNVVIHRLPLILHQEVDRYVADMSGMTYDASNDVNYMGRSKCPGCGSKISWYQNIPLISFMFLKGKCGSCKQKISLRYPAVELAGLLGSVGAVWYFGFTLEAIFAFSALMVMVALSAIDAKHMILPDSLVLVLLALGLANEIYVWDAIKLVDRLEGMVLIFCAMYVFRAAMTRIYGQESVGLGDVKLLTAFAAWMPVYMLLWVVLFGSLMLVIVDRLLRSRRDAEVPFGPWLCFAALITYFNQAPLYMVMF
ncbi:prepilin peptidase [Vibrio owensii]|uniref:prepilin peptidase n=1 Tax=Vibrio owensii TaxID=696485 RepID=UPI0018F22B15|nr:A24 family peptidase [Vibrio owensii]